MTYNFDPDRWYEMERYALDARRDAGQVDDAAYEAEVARLDEAWERMMDRLDGTFRIERA